jgi:glycosyltransferase involved in cell wall biosynthesis
MYKAQDHIAKVLAGLPAFVQTIVVVDDCCPDASYERARAVADARVHFVRHTQNQGVGGAMLSGYKKAVELGAEVVVKMDADDQMDPAYLGPLIAPLLAGEADYAKGNRFSHTRQLQSMPLIRRVGNIGLSFLTKLASGYWNIFDPTNGYTAIHALLIPMLDETAIDRRYFFESSMFLELGLLRAVVRDVYIPAHYGDEKSSLSEHRALFTFPLRLLKGLLRRLWIQYFLRDFGIMAVHLISGSVLTLFGLIFGGYHWIGNAQLEVVTPIGTVMLAAMPVILGVQFLLQAVVLDVQNVPIRSLHRQSELCTVLKGTTLEQS